MVVCNDMFFELDFLKGILLEDYSQDKQKVLKDYEIEFISISDFETIIANRETHQISELLEIKIKSNHLPGNSFSEAMANLENFDRFKGLDYHDRLLYDILLRGVFYRNQYRQLDL